MRELQTKRVYQSCCCFAFLTVFPPKYLVCYHDLFYGSNNEFKTEHFRRAATKLCCILCVNVLNHKVSI